MLTYEKIMRNSMRNIFIFNDHSQHKVDFVQEDNLLVIKGERASLSEVKISELDRPGVYFLLSPNFVYVGQSGRSVATRLNHHLSERKWWTDFLVITDDKGELEKTITEYVEAHYIQLLRKNGVSMDNDTEGNVTAASRFTLSKITAIVHSADIIIKEIFNIDLFQEQDSRESSPTHLRTEITDEYGNVFSGSTLFKSLVLFLSHYAKDPLYYAKLSNEIDNEAENAILTVAPYGEESYTKIANDLFLKKIPSKTVIKAIEEYSEILGIAIEVKGI